MFHGKAILTKKGVMFFHLGSLASLELVITVVVFITLITGNGGSVFAPFTSLLPVSYTSQLLIKNKYFKNYFFIA